MGVAQSLEVSQAKTGFLGMLRESAKAEPREAKGGQSSGGGGRGALPSNAGGAPDLELVGGAGLGPLPPLLFRIPVGSGNTASKESGPCPVTNTLARAEAPV